MPRNLWPTRTREVAASCSRTSRYAQGSVVGVQGGLITGQTTQIEHTVRPVYLKFVCYRLIMG